MELDLLRSYRFELLIATSSCCFYGKWCQRNVKTDKKNYVNFV